MLSGDIERDQWHEMGSIALLNNSNFCRSSFYRNFGKWKFSTMDYLS